MSQENQLQHYGVLGMKWGVRKNPSRAYSKAVAKKKRLETQYSETNLKAAKMQMKATKQAARATSSKKAKKAQKTQFKAAKLNLKSAKLQKKGLKWVRQMDKTFAGYDIRRLSASELQAGKKYVYEVIKRDAG